LFCWGCHFCSFCLFTVGPFFFGGGGAKGHVTSQLLDMSNFKANHFEFVEIVTVRYKSELEAPEILPSVECTFVLTVVMTTVAYVSKCV